MTYVYFIAYKDGNTIIRRNDEALLEKFDTNNKMWIPDDELSQIYFGGLPVKSISEDVAFKHIAGIQS